MQELTQKNGKPIDFRAGVISYTGVLLLNGRLPRGRYGAQPGLDWPWVLMLNGRLPRGRHGPQQGLNWLWVLLMGTMAYRIIEPVTLLGTVLAVASKFFWTDCLFSVLTQWHNGVVFNHEVLLALALVGPVLHEQRVGLAPRPRVGQVVVHPQISSHGHFEGCVAAAGASLLLPRPEMK